MQRVTAVLFPCHAGENGTQDTEEETGTVDASHHDGENAQHQSGNCLAVGAVVRIVLGIIRVTARIALLLRRNIAAVSRLPVILLGLLSIVGLLGMGLRLALGLVRLCAIAGIAAGRISSGITLFRNAAGCRGRTAGGHSIGIGFRRSCIRCRSVGCVGLGSAVCMFHRHTAVRAERSAFRQNFAAGLTSQHKKIPP